MPSRLLDLLDREQSARARAGRWVAAADLPAALTAADGHLREVNRAMEERLGAGSGGIAAYLASAYEVDESLIYRMATVARRRGLSIATVAARIGAVPTQTVAVRCHEAGLLIWTLPEPPELCVGATTDADDVAKGFRSLVQHHRGFPGRADMIRSALDGVPTALMHLDLDGRVLWANALCREMIGGEPVPGIELSQIVESLGRPVEAFLTEASADPRGRREMVRLRGAFGDTFLHIVLTRSVFEQDDILVGVLSDASEIRSLEDKFAQSQKMEAIGKLAGGVAHDFNNVLTAISGHSDLLLLGKDALHPDYSDLMQIRQNTHRAAALVRQLLAFSRKQTLTPKLLSVQDVVSDSLYLLNRLIGEKVTLIVEHGAERGFVRADQQQLEQALMNLVVNARDAMPGGGIVTIATRVLSVSAEAPVQGINVPEGDYVEISVSDSGTGIDPVVIDRVFEPFFTTKPQGEGTGLGLPTVYGIIKQSGGFVFVENRPDGGACFRILLPQTAAGTPDPATEVSAETTERQDLTGHGTVLLVEDEDPVRSFASRALRLRGYDVLEASSAEDAMKIVTTTDTVIDVLVSDVIMPGMDGPTFAAKARTMRPGLKIVFISGYAEDSFRRHLLDHDFLFLPKPFSLTDLTAKVKDALGRSS